MTGVKLSDQRNSRHAGHFKSTNQRLASWQAAVGLLTIECLC